MRGNRALCNARHATTFLVPVVLMLLVGVSAAQKTANPNPKTPTDLVRRVIANELKAEQQDHSHWSLRLKTQKPNGQTEVDEVVETSDGDLKRPILINGRELTPEQTKKANERIQDLARNPNELRKMRAQQDEDTSRSQQLLKMLPDAFQFSYGQRRGRLIELKFSPNPKFHPSTHEAEVFHAMNGSLWLDSKQDRLEEISGHLIRKVKFGGGILGHLDPGGTFDVKQANVASGYWELTRLKVQMKGKALFFKTIGAQQNDTRSDFKQVPDNLPMAQAAKMLEHAGANQ